MKLLKRNLVKLYFSTFNGDTPVVGEEGFYTGESYGSWSEAVEFEGNVSSGRGKAEAEEFGLSVEYDRIILTEHNSVTDQINEQTAIFIDKEPAFDSEQQPLNDYVVTAVRDSFNNRQIAVKRVRS